MNAEVEEPLLLQSRTIEQDVREEGDDKGSLWMVYLSTFVVVWGSYEFGIAAGYSSPTQAAIMEDLNLSLDELPIHRFASFLTHTRTGSWAGGWGALALDIGRLSTGYAIGVFSYVVPVFIAETAPKSIRGHLTTLNQLMIISGVSITFVIGIVLNWRTLALIGLIPCLFLLVGLLFIPESPRWLAKIGRNTEFKEALQKLRGMKADISIETAEIQDYIDILENCPKARLLDLFQRRYLRSLIVGVGLMVCQQFGGKNGISFYQTQVLVSAGFPSNLGIILIACLQVVVTALGAILVDEVGRRALLLISGTGMVIGSLIAALSFYLKAYQLSLEVVPALAITGMLVYQGFFSIGMGAIPWIVMSEIFPINVKGAAGSLATSVNWFGSWICSYTFNYLINWSSYGTYIIYAAINILAVTFIAILVPETKSRTLEEIQAAINKS
ncbi:hypothetical protein ACHQM5_026874 [Ranunculus cassubicifolius]